jgi:hypothetical protein
MGDLSDFERGQIVGERLAGAAVPKTRTILGVSRATVSKVMSIYMNHGETKTAKRNSEKKINIDRKRSLHIDKDCFEKTHNYCSTGDSRTEYSP